MKNFIISNLIKKPDGFLNFSYKSLKTITVLCLLFFSTSSMLAQQKITVTGTVSDETTGDVLPGVNISIQGTTGGGISDLSGKFSVDVPDKNAVLIFSYIGYVAQNIAVGNQSTIEVQLKPDATSVDEVVVVGYGTQKRSTVTGSVVTTSGETIKSIPVSSINNAIVGRMTGVIAMNTSGEPGKDDSRLLIRGNSTTGENAPLIVVDGVADRTGGFSRIDPNDIESVSVLKDASAAIYGSRAANGVILVTTKRGKAGKTSIDYTMDQGFTTPTRLPKMLSSADYAIACNEVELLLKGLTVPKFTDAEVQKFRDGSDPINYPNINPMEVALKKYSYQTKHSLSVSGGNEKVKYFTSIGYQFQDNMYTESVSNYKQTSLRSNVDIQATKSLKFFANVAIRNELRNNAADQRGFYTGGFWRNIMQGDPTKNIYWPDGSLANVTGGYNPINAVNGNTGYVKDNTTRISADLGFSLDFSSIIKGLSIDGGLYFDRSNNFTKNFQKAYTLYDYSSATQVYTPKQYGATNANLNENMRQITGTTANIKLNYTKKIGDLHNINAFVAYEQYESRNDYLMGQRLNYVSPAVEDLFAGPGSSQTNDGNAFESARQNFFGRFDYSYADKYLLQFNARYDGSQNFPEGSRFGFFPGVSAGWRISEEDFWKNSLAFISYFKLRGSWGQMGNDRIVYNGVDQQYTYLTSYTFADNGVFGGSAPAPVTGLQQVQTANVNVTWEVATTMDLGFDAKFLNNQFNLEFDLFKSKRDNILGQATGVVPLYAGLSLPAENFASCQSSGFEVALGYNNTLANGLNINIGANFTYAHSEMLDVNEPTTTLEWQKQTGKPIGSSTLYYESVGIYRTSADLAAYPHLSNSGVGDLIFKDQDNDGQINGNDQIRLAQTGTPEIIYGIPVGLTYKGFDLNILLQGATRVWQYAFLEGGSGGIGNYQQDYFDKRWTPDNINSEGPRIYDRETTGTTKVNTYFLEDATYLRLKNLQLAYSLPQNIITKLKMSNCRVYVSGFNLLTFSKLKDLDPEATTNNQGYAGWNNVQTKVFNLGLNVTF